MRRTVYVAAAIAISAAAIVWSHYAMEQPRASAGPIAAEAAVGISPLEMMQKRDKPLPVETIENPI